jgi:hypothetical protein
VPLAALNEITPTIESTARKKRIQGVELTPVSHFVNSIAPLRTNGSRAAKIAVSIMIVASDNGYMNMRR